MVVLDKLWEGIDVFIPYTKTDSIIERNICQVVYNDYSKYKLILRVNFKRLLIKKWCTAVEKSCQLNIKFNIRWYIFIEASSGLSTFEGEICWIKHQKISNMPGSVENILSPTNLWTPMTGEILYMLICLLSVIHTWRPIVFIQPGMQDMSIITPGICAFKVSVEYYWSWPRQSYL